jgi:hypothetical protein
VKVASGASASVRKLVKNAVANLLSKPYFQPSDCICIRAFSEAPAG